MCVFFRYSIWLDSKLRLQLDPLVILEYFLWREGHEYAISNHYDRHCLWEEVAQNKKLNKYSCSEGYKQKLHAQNHITSCKLVLVFIHFQLNHLIEI